MMSAEAMCGPVDAKQRVELSKESVGAANEKAKAKVRPSLVSPSSCLLALLHSFLS